MPDQIREFLAQLDSWMGHVLFTIGEAQITPGGLLRVAVVLTAAWWISKLGRRALIRVASTHPTMTEASVYTVGRLLHYTIMIVGVVTALSFLGIDLNKFALFASAMGVGVGFGLQTLISNFVAGLMLLFDRTLKVGDYVELESGVTGEVKAINIRSTVMTTNDNVDVIVPNAEFVNGRVTNWTMRDSVRRMRIPFGVSYNADKEVVRRAVLEAASTVSHTLVAVGREPNVWIVEFGDSSINFELAVWLQPDAVKAPTRVQGDYLWAIHTALQQAHIEIPFPQRDLHIRSWHSPPAAGSIQQA
jgi:small-conductance mechanosensitive channel